MMKINWNKIISIMIFAMFFLGGMVIVDTIVYKALPFNHFVEYIDVVHADVCYGEREQEIFVERIVRKDLAGSINSELFLVKHDPDLLVTQANIRVYEEKKPIIYNDNETNSEKIIAKLPHLEVGDYYWIRLVTLELPRGVKKTKVLDPQYFSVVQCDI